MPTSITRDLGRFVAGVRFKDLPPEAVRVAKLGMLDSIAVMIAARADGAPRRLLEALEPAAGDATVLFTPRRASPAEAALVNGTAAHAFDYDDVAMRGHPSCVLAPAILAEAEHLQASGTRMIAAYGAAYEVWAELVLRDPDPQHLRGWHLTGWIGAIAAAAACAALRGLPADQAAMALAIAASQGSGLMANSGTMTKPFHAGWAAHSGVIAARLAARGFTASPDALEQSTGWLRVVSSGGRVDLDAPVTAGRPWRIAELGIAIRRHPVCYVGHRLVDGALAIAERTPLEAADIADVRASLSGQAADILRFHRPTNGAQAKFSAEFGLAVALLKGRITPADLDDAFVQSPAIQSLMARVVVEARDPGAPDAAAEFDHVTIRTRDGTELHSGPVKAIIGSPERPLDAEQLRAKFADCIAYGTQGAATPAFVADFMTRLDTLEQLSDARELRAFAC